jgi:hypothetical protein
MPWKHRSESPRKSPRELITPPRRATESHRFARFLRRQLCGVEDQRSEPDRAEIIRSPVDAPSEWWVIDAGCFLRRLTISAQRFRKLSGSGCRLLGAVNQLRESGPETQRLVNQKGPNRTRLGLPTTHGSKQRDGESPNFYERNGLREAPCPLTNSGENQFEVGYWLPTLDAIRTLAA